MHSLTHSGGLPHCLVPHRPHGLPSVEPTQPELQIAHCARLEQLALCCCSSDPSCLPTAVIANQPRDRRFHLPPTSQQGSPLCRRIERRARPQVTMKWCRIDRPLTRRCTCRSPTRLPQPASPALPTEEAEAWSIRARVLIVMGGLHT